jgi:outer membrane protein TolC
MKMRFLLAVGISSLLSAHAQTAPAQSTAVQPAPGQTAALAPSSTATESVRVQPGTLPPVAQAFAEPTPAVTSAEYTPFFPKPSYFKKVFNPPVPSVTLQPPVRLRDYVVGDKLELSLRSYLELVLANNTDIAIQRLSVETMKNAITRSYGIFDPIGTASFQSTRQQSPTTDALAGAAVLNTLTQPLNIGVQQRLETGTAFNVAFSASKLSTNNAFANFNPIISSGLNLTFVQPLLRDRGTRVNRLPIMVARSRLRQGEYNVEDQVMQLLSNAENAYWDVILARETLGVQEENLRLQGESLARAKRELELGALSELEIYQPEATYANAQIFVTQARYRLAQTEDALRRQIGADLDPEVRKLPIVLTDSAAPPLSNEQFDAEALVAQALTKRPDLRAQVQQFDIDDLNISSAKNQLKPDLSLTGRYGSAGRGGPQYIYDRSGGIGSTPRLIEVIPGGVGTALDQAFGFSFPVYAFGLQLRLPIRDRAASANLADAVVNKRLTALRVRNLEQTTRLQVLNAINNVENSRASVELAKVALDAAEKRRAADQKRFDLGTINMFFLLDAQAGLTTAQSNLVNQTVQYRRNLLNLLRTTGQLLDERGVQIQ